MCFQQLQSPVDVQYYVLSAQDFALTKQQIGLSNPSGTNNQGLERKKGHGLQSLNFLQAYNCCDPGKTLQLRLFEDRLISLCVSNTNPEAGDGALQRFGTRLPIEDHGCGKLNKTIVFYHLLVKHRI